MRVTAEKRKRSAEASLEARKRAGQRPGSPLHQPTVPSENQYNEKTGIEGKVLVKKWKWPGPGDVIEEAGPQEKEERLNELDGDQKEAMKLLEEVKEKEK